MIKGSQFILSTIGNLSGLGVLWNMPIHAILAGCSSGHREQRTAFISHRLLNSWQMVMTSCHRWPKGEGLHISLRSPLAVQQSQALFVRLTLLCVERKHSIMCTISLPVPDPSFRMGSPSGSLGLIPCLEGYFHQLVKLGANITTPNHTEL